MAKFTDAIRNTLITYFNTGDQPTEAQFTDLITRIQEGIEEHDHAGTGDGDGVNNLVGPVGIGAAPTEEFDVANAADNTILVIRTYSDTAGHYSGLFLRKSHHDTMGTLAETIDGEILGDIRFYGVDTGPGWAFGARILATQVGAAGAVTLETDLVLYTHTNAAANTNQLFLDGGTGGIGINTATPFFPVGWVGPPVTLSSQSPNITFVDIGSADATRFIGNSAGTFYLGICDDDGANTANHVAISAAGVVKITDLAGVGQRDVRVNADGTLVAV